MNSRSSPCQGDVITPRPRALGKVSHLGSILNGFGMLFPIQLTILEILPVQPGWEQRPPILVRPLDILNNWPSLIGPYVLHFKQNPSTTAISLSMFQTYH